MNNHDRVAEATPTNNTLFTQERRQQIAQLLEEQQRVTVPELSQTFAVSEVTIRKDLAWLESHNLAVRTHGGAVRVTNNTAEMSFDVRKHLQYNEKDHIGAAAANYVQNGETIFLDASATALAMAHFLKSKRELTVVTTSLRIGMELAGSPGISVLMPGGMLRPESLSLVGTWGQAVLQQIHISKAFVGARGFTFNEGLTEVSSEEVNLKRSIVTIAKEIIAIIDYNKWDQLVLATFCPLERISLIITDAKAPQKMVEQARCKNIDVLVV